MKKALLLVMLLLLSACVTGQQKRMHQEALLAKTYKPFEYKIAPDAKLDSGVMWLKRSLNTTEYGYLRVKDPTGTAPTPVVERFEVRPGDCGADNSWSDCSNDRERSELSEYTRRSMAGQTWWYQWYMYVPKGYLNIYPTKTALGQFHQVKGEPVFMFQNEKGGLYLDDQMRDEFYKLIDKEDLRGRWHKLTLNVHWSKDSDGFFKVWVNDELKADLHRSTMKEDFTYFKYGIYRSFLSRYKRAAGVDEVPGQIVYYSGVKKTKTREELAVD